MIIDGRECCVADILNIIFETEGAILHTWLPPELLSNWRQPSGWNTRWRLQAGRRLGFGYRGVVLRSCHWQIIFLEQIPASKKYKEVLTGGQWLAAILEGVGDMTYTQYPTSILEVSRACQIPCISCSVVSTDQSMLGCSPQIQNTHPLRMNHQ